MRRIVHTIILGIVLSALTSCRAISSFLSEDETVAEVGAAKLYRSELNKLIPKGVATEDSARLASQYINTWALDQVFLAIAEEQLSKSEKDVTRELEDYRKSLLKYRYEQLYVNQRLDTLISEDQIQNFYEQHKDRFILPRPVVKARFMSISSQSPMLKMIQKKMSSDDPQDILEADSLAFSAAFKFTTWSDAWIDAATLAKEFGVESATVLSSVRKGWVEVKDSTGIMNIAYISDLIPAGKQAPQEYSAPFIKDMIISARKQALVLNLERDLLEDARVNGQFVIIE